LANLNEITKPGFYDRLEGLAARWETDLRAAFAASTVPVTINRVGSMLTVFFSGTSDKPVRDYDSAVACDTALYGKFFQACLKEGLYLAPSQFEAGFLSIAHDETILAQVAEKTQRAIKSL